MDLQKFVVVHLKWLGHPELLKKKKNCVDDVPVKFKYQYGIGLWLFPLIFAELVFVNSPSSWTTQIWSYQYCTQINQANGNRARIWLVWELVRGRYKKGVDLTGQMCLARIENEIGWHASFFVFFLLISGFPRQLACTCFLIKVNTRIRVQ